MTDDQPLSPHAATLLEAERARSEALPQDMADRVLGRLATSIATLPDDGGGSCGGGAADPGASPPPAPTAATSASSASIVTARALAAYVVAAFAGGIGVGALGHAALATRETVPTVVAAAPASTEARASAEWPVLDATPVADLPSASPEGAPAATPSSARPAAAPRASTPAPARSDETTKDRGLSRERTLVDQARTAITRGAHADALAALESHAREFPAGRLTEEREALMVVTLANLGRKAEARALARRFRERHPEGLFMPVVEQAVSADR